MELTVSQAAEVLGVATSTLRYWEDEGLLAPDRRHGQRRYSQTHLQRAALLVLARQLQLPLSTAVAVLDGHSPEHRRPLIDAEIARLAELIGRAQGAIDLLTNARNCEHDRPAESCPEMRGALDRLLQGEDPSPPSQG